MSTPKHQILNERELKFVEYYNGSNGKEAYEKAGYIGKNAHNQVHRLLEKPKVQAAIKKKEDAALVQAGKMQAKQRALEETILDIALLEVIQDATHKDRVKAIETGYKELGGMYRGGEQGIKQGIVQHADGGIEVYQSKWLKERNGSNSNGPLSGESVVAED